MAAGGDINARFQALCEKKHADQVRRKGRRACKCRLLTFCELHGGACHAGLLAIGYLVPERFLVRFRAPWRCVRPALTFLRVCMACLHNRTRGAQQESENIWKFWSKFVELDDKKKDGNCLDEFEAHRFLESLNEAMSVVEMRKKLREIDVNSDGQTSMIEYLIFRYNFTVEQAVNAPQGENQAEVARAQAMFDQVNAALDQQREAVAQLAAAEAELAAAEAELQAAVDALKAEEDAYHGRIAACEKIANDESIGVVKRNKAANELAQLKGEDQIGRAHV